METRQSRRPARRSRRGRREGNGSADEEARREESSYCGGIKKKGEQECERGTTIAEGLVVCCGQNWAVRDVVW
eukprot:767799-Hanusia_phi.AAC.2